MQIWSQQPRKEVHPMNSKMQSEERGMREIFCRYIWRYGDMENVSILKTQSSSTSL